MKVSRKFIMEAYDAACSGWKQRIEEEFPELFNNKKHLGKWMIGKHHEDGNKALYYVTSIDVTRFTAYGLNWDGEWVENKDFGDTETLGLISQQATDSEVENMLRMEAIKRGFTKGSKVGNACNKETGYVTSTKDFRFYQSNNELLLHGGMSNGCGIWTVFSKGKWGKVYDTRAEKIERQIEKLQNQLNDINNGK